MLLTCEKCHTQYKLGADAVSAGGRMVRCTHCFHTWFFEPESAVSAAEVDETPEHIEAHHAPGGHDAHPPAPAEAASFKEMVAAETTPAPADKPPAILSPQAEEMPVILHNPAGLGANAFGAAVFFALLSVTVIALILARVPLTHHYPALSALYTAAGIDVRAPGEGLSLTDFSARMGEDGALLISAKINNISQGGLPYPELRISALGPYDGVLKSWELHPSAKEIAPGGTGDIDVTFKDLPQDAKTATLTVTGP